MGKKSLWDYANLLPQYTELAFKRRGELINQTIMLERFMDEYIASFFCPTLSTRRTELLTLILSTERMTFDSKKTVAAWIVKNYDKEMYKSLPTIAHDLETIGRQRNILAHQLLDISAFKEAINASKIVLKKYKDKIHIIEYDETTFSEMILLINKYAGWFFNRIHIHGYTFPPDLGTSPDI